MQHRKNFIKTCLSIILVIVLIYVTINIFKSIAIIFSDPEEYYYDEIIELDSITDMNETVQIKMQTIAELSAATNSEKIVTKSVLSEQQNTFVTKTKVVETNTLIPELDETILSSSTLEKLKTLLKCGDSRYFERTVYQRGQYWVLKNYVRANHGNLECHSDVTFVTHGDFTYMDELIVLVQKWMGPISIALYAPGSDFNQTISSIRYVRDCSKAKELIRNWVTFHVYFDSEHIIENMSEAAMFNDTDFINAPYNNCEDLPPFHLNNSDMTYSKVNDLLYPINVGRNIAREAALTHYFLSLDVELYPIPKLGARFLNMLARNPAYISGDRPRVFVLKPFEVEANQNVPENKTRLIEMLKNKSAIPFHQSMCPGCHNVPYVEQWMSQGQTKYLEITGIGKRTGKFKSWEPLFISTHSIPYLEERLSWNGKRDKMTQTYVLCVMDYDFFVLSNAFVTHHPGIKKYVPDSKRASIAAKQSYFIDNKLSKELKAIYGTRDGCIL